MALFLHKRLVPFLIAFCILISCLPAGVRAEDILPTEPTVSVPEEAVPEESQPEPSVPEESVPDESQPEPSAPEESIPEETQPEPPLPEESIPEETLPEPSVPEESIPEETAVSEISEDVGPGLYFGCFHAHTNLSDGMISVEDAFGLASSVEGLDFFAVTDHSDSFDHSELGSIGSDGAAVSSDWAAGKAAAAAVTTDAFVGLFGYEMSWPVKMKLGHISTFNTPGFQTWQQPDYSRHQDALQHYYEVLSSVPLSLGQFNHPGRQYGTFLNFSGYTPAADEAMVLLEVGGSDNDAPYRYYTQALDAGWHVAPSNNQAGRRIDSSSIGAARTVVYAQSLTESGIYDALHSYRVYATEDPDLEILYTMNGHVMGSILEKRHLGETAQISVSLSDPTDDAVGLAEIIVDGGVTAASQTLSSSAGTLTFDLAPEYGYYYLRITQPDGDSAVTAPIWVDDEEDLGICGFECDTALPVQGEPVFFTLELYNREASDFLVNSLTLFADGIPIRQDDTLTHIPGGSSLSHSLSLACTCVGHTDITVTITGTLDGSQRTYEASIPVSFRQSRQVTGILVDSSHENAGLSSLSILNGMALQNNIRITATSENDMAQLLPSCRFLLVSAPAVPFSQEFLELAAEYAAYGGSIILCNHAAGADPDFQSTQELNRLLQAIGSTMTFRQEILRDPVHSDKGGCLYTDVFHPDSSWCDRIGSNQLYRFASGVSLNPGNGTWLVKGPSTTGSEAVRQSGSDDTPVLLACETLSGGGTVFASGSLFLSDENLAEPQNIWDEPYGNRTIAQTLLGIGGDVVPLSTIAQARAAESGFPVRIRGYVTAGTSNPHNTFPDTLYLQDETGGIAVIPFRQEGIQLGTPIEFTGTVSTLQGNRILTPTGFSVLDAEPQRILPKTGTWDTLLDPAANGGMLVKAEGECQEILCRPDGTLAGFTLRDGTGRMASVRIEDCIFSGSTGKNELHLQVRKGRIIRATGIVHTDENGQSVIRVRNCGEVTYVPPLRYHNPYTADRQLILPLFGLWCSMAALILLHRKKA